jgi:hypothetical protein
MSFSQEDLAQLGGFVRQLVSDEISTLKTDLKQDAETMLVQNRTATVGAPDVDPEAGPDYYVHLADGTVVTSKDSSSTHLANDAGESVAVIGRFQKGA